MEAARAVKMHWQNVREQNQVDDVFATVETRENELERCHLLEKRPPTRFSGPAEAYQLTDVREYFSAECENVIGYIASQQITQ